jgi:hypothetical protein
MSAKKAQYSTEYVIIIAIGIGLIASFLFYAVFFYGSFASTSSANDITNVASSIAKQANYVSAQGVGSIQTFPITIPLLEPQYSFFCGDIIKLQTTTELGVASPAGNVSGMLPLTGGTYVAFVKEDYNQTFVGLKFAVSLIIQSDTISASSSSETLNYNLKFYNYSLDPIPTPVTFNLSVFTTDGVYVASLLGSTSSSSPNKISGTLSLPLSNLNLYVVEVTPSSSGDYASACVSVN